jgi:serine acetyltransferase
MYNQLTKHGNSHPSADVSAARWFSFFKAWKDARMSRKAWKAHTEAVAALNEHQLYDIGEQDIRPQAGRSALLDHDPYTLLINGVLHR